METDRLAALKDLTEAFVRRPGTVTVHVASKTDPALSVALNTAQSLPSASVIKAAIACAAVDTPGLDLAQTIPRADLDDTFYCSILHAFEPEDVLSLKSLIGLMLIVSDNPATSAILEAVGTDTVNAWLRENGLTETNIEVGFDDASLGAPLRANLTTADDCLTLLKLIDQTPHYGFIKRMLANNLRNERIPKCLPDDAVIAHKTGTLNGLVHDIAIVESPIAAYYLVVLADGLEDDAAFARDLAAYSDSVYGLMAG
ncbi:MAG: serine hydrolase [Henriciella sp.]